MNGRRKGGREEGKESTVATEPSLWSRSRVVGELVCKNHRLGDFLAVCRGAAEGRRGEERRGKGKRERGERGEDQRERKRRGREKREREKGRKRERGEEREGEREREERGGRRIGTGGRGREGGVRGYGHVQRTTAAVLTCVLSVV